MRILLVAMSDSIHTARWISQITDQGWDLHLFPSIDGGLVHPRISNIVVYRSLNIGKKIADAHTNHNNVSSLQRAATFCSRGAAFLRRRLLTQLFPKYRAVQLKRLIDRLRPDIVHSLEIQHAGYLTLEAKMLTNKKFPPWMVTNWGSDIYLFGRLPEHHDRIKAVMSACDYYHCECHRDVKLGQAFGFEGEIFPVFPVAGGYDVERLFQFRQPGPPSARRLIALKGYQHWAGRGLVGLRAIELCADLLTDYRVIIYSANPDVKIAAQLVAQSTGIRIDFDTDHWSHEDILRMHGHARISIGLSISDAISTSFLETIIMGSFPIQSNTSCGNEWVEHGVGGLFVEPNSPETVADAIRKALTDDVLVDGAAEINARLAAERLDKSVVQPQAVAMYEKVSIQNR